MTCTSCGAHNPDGNRFCRQCGTTLGHVCPSCGADEPADAAFCGACGTPLTGGAPATPTPTAGPGPTSRIDDPATAMAERRRVSVLFVDLVGFTSMSEGRDPEAVRELLTRYFDAARTIVDRYGGTIEKFIGDAVMAVWGTPVAREDDVERAVRAALELVDAVTALDDRHEGLQARAGVVTGETAVRLDAVGQGMVAGDVVNTAARVQATAPPGAVWVDDATREASSRAIAYLAAGEHVLRGRSEPARLFRAEQVVAGAGGAQRFDGLEAPFAGRDRDLRVVKELFHDAVEQDHTRLVLVSGVAGVGKSRLGWELFKYLDGITLSTYWHIGRCLSYGEGVAYWALAEMVRMRLRITEGDPPATVAERLDAGLAEHVPDAEDRVFLRPRLAVLLGLDEPEAMDRDTLFAGWRLFLERLAERDPVVLLFEDLQNADTGLLDFVDHLLEWSTDLPIFMLGLTRPELFDARPGWGGAHRRITVLTLDPLPHDVIAELVGGLVHGLPEETRRDLALRAEGIPLFALETVRMLVDRDVVVPRDGVYVLDGDIGDVASLEVPPTLQALVAARLDDLPETERRLVKDAAVLGMSFTPAALVALEDAVQGVPVGQVGELLTTLARREILTVRGDDRSPEAGQYRFVQKVMRAAAYETLSRRDRKARHLAAATYWEATGDSDVAGVVASHLLDAADAVPDDADADDLRLAAVTHLERAGDRARSLAASDEAMRYYERALALATSPADLARLSERAGVMARRANRPERALELLEQARTGHEALGDVRAAAGVAAHAGDVLGGLDRTAEALELMKASHARHDGDTSDPNLAQLATSIGVALMTTGQQDEGDEWLERALVASEASGAWDTLCRALNARAIWRQQAGRVVEGRILMRGALELAIQHGLHGRVAMQSANIAVEQVFHDLDDALALCLAGREASRQTGDLFVGAFALSVLEMVRVHRGDWDDIDVAELRRVFRNLRTRSFNISLLAPLAALAWYRGQPELLDGLSPDGEHDPDDWAVRVSLLTASALVAGANGDMATAASQAIAAIELSLEADQPPDEILLALPTAVDALLATRQPAEVRRLVDAVADRPQLSVPPLLAAHVAWSRARIGDAPGTGFVEAARQYAELGTPFWRARCELDHAEWLADQDQAAAVELAQHALVTLDALGARPHVDRARRLLAPEHQLTTTRPTTEATP